MKGKTYSCGLEGVLEIAGGKWKALALWQLSSGPRRFGELRRAVPGISEKMLIQTLREMQGDGIVERRDFREVTPRVEYALTPFGITLKHALRPLCAPGTKHMKRIATRAAERD